MAKVNEITQKKQTGIVNNGQEVKLNETNVFQFLKMLMDKGYMASKSLTIKDGALLQKYFDILMGTVEKSDEDPSEPEIYKSVLTAIGKSNEEGAFTINDASVIDRLLTFINETMGTRFGMDQDQGQGSLEL